MKEATYAWQKIRELERRQSDMWERLGYKYNKSILDYSIQFKLSRIFSRCYGRIVKNKLNSIEQLNLLIVKRKRHKIHIFCRIFKYFLNLKYFQNILESLRYFA